MKEGADFWAGTALRRWLLAGGQPPRSSTTISAWRCRAFDICANMQSLLPPPPSLKHHPFFIAGMWRTGSTFVHELVAATGLFQVPRTFQCLRPSSFRLVSAPQERSVDRPMDGVSISTFSPQEDEFALLLSGAPSLYRGFFDPRRLLELAPLLEGGDADDWQPILLPFLRTVAASSPHLPLALKSPNHLFRHASLRSAFPQSPWLLLFRDPTETWLSNVRMWTSMIERHGLWEPPADTVQIFVSRAMLAAAAHLDELRNWQLAGGRLTTLRFEDLRRSPESAVLNALGELGFQMGVKEKRSLAQAIHHLKREPWTRPVQLPRAGQAAASALLEAQARFPSST